MSALADRRRAETLEQRVERVVEERLAPTLRSLGAVRDAAAALTAAHKASRGAWLLSIKDGAPASAKRAAQAATAAEARAWAALERALEEVPR